MCLVNLDDILAEEQDLALIGTMKAVGQLEQNALAYRGPSRIRVS
jgi:hypothetical protein